MTARDDASFLKRCKPFSGLETATAGLGALAVLAPLGPVRTLLLHASFLLGSLAWASR